MTAPARLALLLLALHRAAGLSVTVALTELALEALRRTQN